MNTDVQYKTIYNRLGQIGIIALLAVGIMGCYWTQPDPSGQLGITIEAAEVTGSSEIGASATLEELDGLIALYLISEGVMNQGEQAFNDVTTELSNTLQDTFGGSDPTGELEQTTFTAETEGAQVVWKLFDSSQGTSGSITLTDLEVGEEYFVFAGGGTNGREGQYVGFDTATIGTTDTVTLRLQSDFSEFYSFVVENYQFTPVTEPVYAAYGRADDATPFIVPFELFVDVIDASVATIDVTQYKTDIGTSPNFYISDSSGEPPAVSLAQRLTEMSYLSTDGSSIDSSSGFRSTAPASGGLIGEFEYGQQIQLVLTSTPERGTDTTNEDLATHIGITEPFVVGVDQTPFVGLYEWASGF